MLTRDQLLLPLARLRSTEVVVTCMSVTRPWGRLSDHDLDFASADSAMGHTADLALGLALSQPARKVVCLNGDGSMLMSLGTLVTVVEADARNLVLFVLENGAYEITGNQPIPGAGRLDFPGLARAAGFGRVYAFSRAAEYEALLPEALAGEGPVFVSVVVEPGSEGPISRSPREDARYLQTSLAEWSREFRRALLRPPLPVDPRGP
jgi:thiamine pyrophosphate-dependent acetolactate synthase large subunit-like protein